MKSDESSGSDNLLDRYQTARSKDATWEQLEPLIESGEEQLIRETAKNPNIPAEELTKLADHESVLVVCSVAENRSTPPETLWVLAKRALPVNNLFIHEEVAGNPSAPRELLEYMVDNTNEWDVVKRVAENPATPEDILERLLDDGFGSGRQFLLEDNYPPTGKFRTRESHLGEVQAKIAERENLSPELARKLIPNYAGTLSANFYAPKEVLEELLDHPDKWVRDNAHDTLYPPD